MTDEIEVEVYNEDESALRPGTLLCGGKYRIVKKLGQGGFGITYLGEQIALNRRVAIKEYFDKALSSDRRRRHMLQWALPMGVRGGRHILQSL